MARVISPDAIDVTLDCLIPIVVILDCLTQSCDAGLPQTFGLPHAQVPPGRRVPPVLPACQACPAWPARTAPLVLLVSHSIQGVPFPHMYVQRVHAPPLIKYSVLAESAVTCMLRCLLRCSPVSAGSAGPSNQLSDPNPLQVEWGPPAARRVAEEYCCTFVDRNSGPHD